MILNVTYSYFPISESLSKPAKAGIRLVLRAAEELEARPGHFEKPLIYILRYAAFYSDSEKVATFARVNVKNLQDLPIRKVYTIRSSHDFPKNLEEYSHFLRDLNIELFFCKASRTLVDLDKLSDF